MLPRLSMRRLGAAVALLAVLSLIVVVASPSSRPAEARYPSSPIRIAGVGANDGDEAANDIPLDLRGATVARLTEAEFNAMSPSQLRQMFDVLIITWDSDPSLNVDWATRVRPFLRMGGGVIYEDPNNLDDLAAIIQARGDDDDTVDGSGLIRVTRRIAGLADGVSDNLFSNNHIVFDSWARGLSPFLANNGGVVGLFGPLEGGCIILTGPDQDFHGLRGGDAEERNQYQLILNEARFAASRCGGGQVSR